MSDATSNESKAKAATAFSPVEIIAKKRDGNVLSREEIEFFVGEFNAGSIQDYQMSAMLMAIYLRGMNDLETAQLTLAMANSGTIADWSSIKGPKVDKHSSGGVGDKVSLILAPLVASLGLHVPMMSGRGLGHTGGTLDKLEAIPGFSSSLGSEKFHELVSSIGCAIIAPTSNIAPVDKRIYALRDVTATTESLPLLCSSIMSKKLAEAPDALVLDVKVGRGAFLKKFDESVALAKAMVAAGTNAKIPTVALLTDMDQPLGFSVGNWLETRESIELLHGRGPADVREVVVLTAAHMLVLGKLAASLPEGRALAEANLDNGKAFAKFVAMVKAQGGDENVIQNPEAYPEAKFSAPVVAPANGFITSIDPLEIGLTSVGLGAGRQAVTDTIDYTAGMLFHKKVGDAVQKGDTVVMLYTEKGEDALKQAQQRVQNCIQIGPQKPTTDRDRSGTLLKGIVTHEKGFVQT